MFSFQIKAWVTDYNFKIEEKNHLEKKFKQDWSALNSIVSLYFVKITTWKNLLFSS